MNEIKIKFKKQFRKIMALCIGTILGIGTIISVNALSQKVCVNVDNEKIYVSTFSTETNKILDSAGIKLCDGDIVNRDETNSNLLVLDVKRAFDVMIKDDNKGEEIRLKITEGKVSDALKLANIEPKEDLTVNYDLDGDLKPGMEIKICKMIKIAIDADGQQHTYFAPPGTVEEVLGFLKIPFSGNDIINVDMKSNIYENMDVKINRVVYSEAIKTEYIDFEKIIKKTSLLKASEQQILKKGEKGKKEVIVKEMLIDGTVKKSEIIKEVITLAPVNEEILIGDGRVQIKNEVKLGSKNNDLSGYVKVATGDVTAYVPTGNKTATGSAPVAGETIAVDFKKIPRGSKVAILYKDGTVRKGLATDTGGALKNGKIVADYFVATLDEAKRHGRKKADIYMLP